MRRATGAHSRVRFPDHGDGRAIVADGTGADPDVEPDVDDLVAWIADRVGAEQPVYQPRHRLAHVRSP